MSEQILAGRARRMGAFILDLIVAISAQSIALGLVGIVVPLDEHLWTAIIAVTPSSSAWLILGPSLGKFVFGIRVLDDASGTAATLSKRLLRGLPLFIFPIEVIMLLATNRRLGDRLAGTTVTLEPAAAVLPKRLGLGAVMMAAAYAIAMLATAAAAMRTRAYAVAAAHIRANTSLSPRSGETVEFSGLPASVEIRGSSAQVVSRVRGSSLGDNAAVILKRDGSGWSVSDSALVEPVSGRHYEFTTQSGRFIPVKVIASAPVQAPPEATAIPAAAPSPVPAPPAPAPAPTPAPTLQTPARPARSSPETRTFTGVVEKARQSNFKKNDSTLWSFNLVLADGTYLSASHFTRSRGVVTSNAEYFDGQKLTLKGRFHPKSAANASHRSLDKYLGSLMLDSN